METKVCRLCLVQKSQSDFDAKRGVCRECFNKKRRETRSIKNKENKGTNILSSLKQILLDVKIAYENYEFELDKIMPILEEAMKEWQMIKEHDNILEFEYTLNPELYTYLEICYKTEKFDQDRVHDRIYDRQYSAEFFKSHGLSQQTLIDNAHHLTYLFDTMNGIKAAYNFFIEDYNFARKGTDNFVKMLDILPHYNVFHHSIVIPNPLELDAKTFFTKVKNETKDQYVIKAFHEMKKFDMFYKKYDIK
jgi:hypothetical protein